MKLPYLMLSDVHSFSLFEGWYFAQLKGIDMNNLSVSVCQLEGEIKAVF